MSKITCRPYRPGDETGILELYRSVFGLDQSLDWWRWFYECLPHGPAIITVAENDERIVGHYAVQPRPFWYDGEPCLAGLAVGTMISPEARNIATLMQLGKLAYEICRQRNVKLLYAFPNDQAWRVRKALLAWQPLPDMIEWDGLLPTPSDRPQRPYDIISKPQARQISDPGLPLVSAAGTIGGRRDWVWLCWRFFDHPTTDYNLHLVRNAGQIAGYAITKLFRRDGILYGHMLDGNVAPDAPSAADDLLAAVWSHFAAQEVERFSCWAPVRSLLAAALAEAGIARQGRPSNFGYLPLNSASDELLSDANAWHVFMADSDVY